MSKGRLPPNSTASDETVEPVTSPAPVSTEVADTELAAVKAAYPNATVSRTASGNIVVDH